MRLQPPPPRATFGILLDDGTAVPVRRYGNPNGVRLFISHGNGFAVDAYFPFWKLLLDDFDLVLFDFRNHGRNLPSDPKRHNYAQMARDIERVFSAVTEALGRKTSVGVFHSMSARAAMKHAVEIGWRWDALALYDPPNVPPPDHPLYEQMRVFEKRLVSWALSRRSRFAAPDELAEEYARSRAAANWVEGAHELMARSVLRRSPEGEGWALVCAPELEASIYAEALTLNLWPRYEAYGGPVRLIGADPAMTGGPATGAANQALAAESGYDYLAIPGAGHLLQIEKPVECAGALREFLSARGLLA